MRARKAKAFATSPRATRLEESVAAHKDANVCKAPAATRVSSAEVAPDGVFALPTAGGAAEAALTSAWEDLALAGSGACASAWCGASWGEADSVLARVTMVAMRARSRTNERRVIAAAVITFYRGRESTAVQRKVMRVRGSTLSFLWCEAWDELEMAINARA